MIKSLLNADEEPSPKKDAVFEEKSTETPPVKELAPEETAAPPTAFEPIAESVPQAKTEPPRDVFEIPADAKFFSKPEENEEETQDYSKLSEDELEKLLEVEEENYKNLNTEPIPVNDFEQKAENEVPLTEPPQTEEKIEEKTHEAAQEKTVEKTETQISAPSFGMVYDYEPESQGETIRKSGLAYSAAIVLLASVIFMMILGWFADLLLGSSPWGVVGGIILGGIIGFIQFFRISSSIFKK